MRFGSSVMGVSVTDIGTFCPVGWRETVLVGPRTDPMADVLGYIA